MDLIQKFLYFKNENLFTRNRPNACGPLGAIQLVGRPACPYCNPSLFCPDVYSDLPHFSSPALVNKYAVIEQLDFSYYLRHARPSFAFGTFVVQQLAKSKAPEQL